LDSGRAKNRLCGAGAPARESSFQTRKGQPPPLIDFSSQRKRRLCGLLSWTEINESYNSQYKCV
jgi:hypothetical protein